MYGSILVVSVHIYQVLFVHVDEVEPLHHNPQRILWLCMLSLQMPKPVTAARDVPIWYYLISGVGADSIQVAPSGSCSDGRCSHEVDVPDDGSTEYNVSVAAVNELGVGDATIVGPICE